MKLKVKLPLLFLLMFLLIGVSDALYLNTRIVHEKRATVSGLEHVQMLLFLFVVAGLIFAILTIYFHFNITKPIQILNVRLKSENAHGLRF